MADINFMFYIFQSSMNEIENIVMGRKQAILEAKMEDLREIVDKLEVTNKEGNIGFVKIILKDPRELINLEDIENKYLQVIGQKWNEESETGKLTFVLKKRQPVREILRMKPVGQTRYNAGDISIEELVKNSEQF